MEGGEPSFERTIVGERGGAFRRIVEGGEGGRLSCGQQQVFASNLFLQTFDKIVSGGFLLVCIDRAISADMRRRFSANAALPAVLTALGLSQSADLITCVHVSYDPQMQGKRPTSVRQLLRLVA